MKQQEKSKERGVALVATMIVVAVLAVVAVAFMQSTSTDRLSSRTAANYAQARLAAKAGASAAEALVAEMLLRYPDSVTVWQNIGSGGASGTNNEATVLYARAQSANTNLGARPAQFGGEVALLGRPLVSGSSLVPLGSVAGSMTFAANNTNMVNLNATNAARPRPFVGRRSATNPGAPVTAAQWIYLTNAAGQTNARYAFWIEDESFKVNINVVTNGPRLTSSLGLAPSELRLDGSWGSSADSQLRGAGAGAVIGARSSLGNSSFPSALSAVLPAGISSPEAADELKFLTTAHSAGLDLSRGGFKRFNINSLGFNNIVSNALTPLDSSNAGQVRSNLNRVVAALTNSNSVPNFGQRFYRLNNNAAGINSSNAVSTNHAAIYVQKVAANLLDYIDDNDQPTVISNNASFSLVTGRPTVGILPVGGGTAGSNPIAAVGVENVPRLQEYAVHLRVRKMQWDPANPDSFGFVFNTNQGAVNPTLAEYEVWLDHYFEFWNPGTRNFTNSPDTFLKIFDQPKWGPGSGGGVVTGTAGRGSGDFTTNNRVSSEIPLIDAITGDPVVFPAGEVTVLTTAPLTALNTGTDPNGVLVVTTNPSALVPLANVPASDRVFTGTTSSIRTANYDYQAGAAPFNGGPDFGYNRLFEVQMQFGRPAGTSVTDYASGVLIGNNQGIIESHVGLPIGVISGNSKFSAIVESSWNRNDLRHVPGNIPNGQVDNVRGGGMRGNANNGASTASSKPNPREGDPRSLLEQLELNIYSAGGSPDHTRFYNSIGPGASPVFVNNTFGRPNTNYVLATNWTDSSSINAGASNAPLFVRNGAMQSIGELGHITDPARAYITNGSVPLGARGGGRTLRVGQSELTNSGGTNVTWYDGNQTNASRTWTSWRLADIFTTTSASTNGGSLDPQGHLTNRLGVSRGPTNTNLVVLSIPGLINPNGSLRDGGAALRAAFEGLRFLPSPDGSINTANRPANVNSLATAVLTRMTNLTGSGLPAGTLNPFWERGELSELSLFNSATTLSGVSMQQAFDRGREEVIRRSIEMITTRGSTFTVYVIGQKLQGTNVTGTARLSQTFQLEPQFAYTNTAASGRPPGYADDMFDPGNAAAIEGRFRAPTNYTTRVLATSYD